MVIGNAAASNRVISVRKNAILCLKNKNQPINLVLNKKDLLSAYFHCE